MEGSDGGCSAAAPIAHERLSGEAPSCRADSPPLPRHAPPIAVPLPASSESGAGAGAGAEWRRRAARCLLLGPLALGGVVLVACFLMCPMLWLLAPQDTYVAGATVLSVAAVCLWASAAAAVFLYWRQRRRGRRLGDSPRRGRPPPTPPSPPSPPPSPHRPRSQSLGSTKLDRQAWGAGAEAERQWRRGAARCVVLCPLATGGALLMACFLLCPILWLRMPPGTLAVSRAVLLGGGVVSVWAFVAGAVFCWRRARRRARLRHAAPRRPPSPPWARSRSRPPPPPASAPPPRPRSHSLGALRAA